MNNIVVLGNGYIGSAYADSGINCITKEQFRYDGNNINDLYPLIANYETIINAMGWTNTTSSELSENFRLVWNVNVDLVEKLSNFCKFMKKKFVHLSTGDLYGNTFDIDVNIESTTKIDVGTVYRLSKYVGEKFCNSDDLILRLRLPFDGRNHPKNLLTKIPKFKKLYSFVNDYTYVPDLMEATKTLINTKQSGIFNVVSHEDGSVIYLLRNVLELPEFQSYDLHDENHPDIIRELNNIHVHNVSNDEKLRGYFIQTPLDDAIKKSWKELHNI